MTYIFYVLTIILILNVIYNNKILAENRLAIKEQSELIAELERKNNTLISSKDLPLDDSNSKAMMEKYEKEFNGKVSHVFDGSNEWIGYEFITEISPTQTVIKYMSHEGKLQKIKHVFDKAPYGSKTQDDFNSYMNSVKSKASIYNWDYLSDAKAKSIDLQSSVEEAKIYRRYGI